MSQINLSSLNGLTTSSNYSNYNFNYNYKNTTTSSYKYTYGKNNSVSSEQTKAYLADIKSISNQLKNSADNILGKNSVLNKTLFTSLNQDSFTLKSTSTEKVDVKDLQVTQLAKTQMNTGSSLNATATSQATTGKNQFGVTMGGKNFYYDVSVNSSDSNKAVQQKMADAINQKGNGLKATVQYNEKDKTSSLLIESKETGTKNAFSIRDVQGNLVGTTGTATTTQQSQDSKYKLNGEDEKTASSNTVEIAKGVTAEFKSTTTSAVKIESKKDTTASTNAVYDLVNNYNALLDSAKSNSTDSGAKRLAQQLTSAVKTYATSLGNVGINLNKDGYISLDTDKLTKSIENGSLQKALAPTNTSFGFTSKIQQIAKKVESDPTYYVSQASQNTLAESNKQTTNPYSNKSYNYLSSYMNQKYTNAGLLFESMF